MTAGVAALPPHPLAAWEGDRTAALADLDVDPREVIDLGLGDSAEPVAPEIRRALVEAVGETTRYPPASGLPELRAACAAWARRRYGAALDPDAEVQPTQGAKEAIFSLALVVREPGRDLVAVTTPGYAIPERGARVAGLVPLELPLRPERGFLPDLDEVAPEAWDRLAVFWLNSPNNPTGAVAPRALLEELAARARRHGFVLAADEAYSELYEDEPPPGVLALGSHERVLAFHSLSKRSGLTGYRSGFVAGDAALIAALRRYRAMAGQAPTEFVQRAAVAAWGDEEHAARRRALVAAKRAVLREGLGRGGLDEAGSAAGMFLWARAPGGDADGFARALLARGVAVVPGRYLGPGGEGWLRLAPAPALAACEEAAERIAEEGRAWTT